MDGSIGRQTDRQIEFKKLGVAWWWKLKRHISNEKSNNKNNNSSNSQVFGLQPQTKMHTLHKHHTAYLAKWPTMRQNNRLWACRALGEPQIQKLHWIESPQNLFQYGSIKHKNAIFRLLSLRPPEPVTKFQLLSLRPPEDVTTYGFGPQGSLKSKSCIKLHDLSRGLFNAKMLYFNFLIRGPTEAPFTRPCQ